MRRSGDPTETRLQRLRFRLRSLMLYAAKCYWPQVTASEVEHAGARASREETGYRGALLFPDDQLVLYLFDASSPAAVMKASARAGIPCERVMESRWLARQPCKTRHHQA